jgi:hypothetical protein
VPRFNFSTSSSSLELDQRRSQPSHFTPCCSTPVKYKSHKAFEPEQAHLRHDTILPVARHLSSCTLPDEKRFCGIRTHGECVLLLHMTLRHSYHQPSTRLLRAHLPCAPVSSTGARIITIDAAGSNGHETDPVITAHADTCTHQPFGLTAHDLAR